MRLGIIFRIIGPRLKKKIINRDMFYTYILKSLKNNDIYIGSTADFKNRLSLHNSGKVKSTKPYRLWQLLEYQEYNSRSEAVRMEKFLKSGQQREILKKKYGPVAKR